MTCRSSVSQGRRSLRVVSVGLAERVVLDAVAAQASRVLVDAIMLGLKHARYCSVVTEEVMVCFA